MPRKRESRDWYNDAIRAIALREDLPMFERMGYCYQTLLNFQEKYDTKKIGRDRNWLVVWAKYIRENCLVGIANNVDGDWPHLYWDVMLMESRHMVVDSYFLYLERKREQHAKFYEPRREILMKHGVVQALQDLVDDKLDLLSISMPPGSGKSTLEIFLLSGIIGWYPDMPNLASSFSGTMTKSLYDGVNQILTEADEYSWHEVFPDVTFKARDGTNSKDQTINVGKRKRFKSLTCRAINADHLQLPGITQSVQASE